MRHTTPVTNSAALCRSLPNFDRLKSHFRGTQAGLPACTAHSRLKRSRPKLLHASLQQHQASPHRDSSYSKNQLNCCPHTRTLHVASAIARPRPLSETAQPQQSQMLPGSVFRSCFNLIQQGKTGLGLDLLERLIGEHGPPDKADGFTILLAIASPGKQGRLEPALDCLQILPSERGRYYFELIKHYCSKGNCYALGRLQKALFADHRWKTFQQYPGAAWFGLVYSYGLLSRPDLAIAAFDEMQALGVWRPNDKKTANALLNAILSDANQMFDRFEMLTAAGLEPDLVTYNTMLKCCMRNNLPDKALHLFGELTRQNIPADEFTFTTLIKTLTYTGRVDEALQVQQSMQLAKFEATDTVWGSLIVACGRAGQLESALSLWQEFKQARGGLHNITDTGPCKALLIACGQAYQLHPALKVLEEMKAAGVPCDTTVYNCVMATCGASPGHQMSAENLDVAFGLLEEMRGRGVEADDITYSTLLNLCAEARQGHQALQLMQSLQESKTKLNTVVYTAFIKACGSSPDLAEHAHAAFKKMVWGPRRMKPNQITFVTCMRVLREANHLHEALDVYSGMRRAGFPGVNSEFQELVKACAEAALETNDSELKTKVGDFLIQSKQEGKKEIVDLHNLSAKEARAAVLCVLCNIQERFKTGKAIPGELCIIVGQGQHAQPGGPKLRWAIEQLLQKHLHMELDQVKAPLGTVNAQDQKLQNATPTTDPSQSESDYAAHTDIAAERRAQSSDALTGSKQYDTQHILPLAVSTLSADMPVSNLGRITISHETLLQWLRHKAPGGAC